MENKVASAVMLARMRDKNIRKEFSAKKYWNKTFNV